MMTRAVFRDFQPHKKVIIDFDLITVIVGSSDKGKSAFMRGLGWVFRNEPQGDKFVRWGQRFASVLIDIDGHTVGRKRGAGVNKYTLDGEEFVAFGTTVPEPIAALLAITPTNVQEQLDSPFWFMLSPGQVSRELNAIINLDVIDSTMAALAQEVRKAKATVEVTETRLLEAKAARAETRGAEEYEAKVKAAEETLESCVKTDARRRDLSKIVSDITETKSTLRRAESKAVHAKRSLTLLDSCKSLHDNLLSKNKQLVKLRSLIKTIASTEKQICQHKTETERLRKLVNAQKTCPICGTMLSRS
jgi:DNA repair protein SbcC/Rad50